MVLPSSSESSPATSEASYRPDIDGLRAIAVLAVVGFHALPRALPGGFAGVDIFFVISGYLISGILLRELEQNRFNLLRFYERRARRIFPALALVLMACLVCGWFTLLQDEFTQLGKHVFAGAAFVANIVSWREAGYFDEAAELKPLLHLWSLGIEEQFYFVWPLLLALTRRWAVPAFVMTGGVIAASFALNVFTVESHPVAAFYLPFTRFWELAVGGFLASRELHRRGTPPAGVAHANVKAALGLGLLVASLLLLTEHKPFPGWWAALPTLGAALLISASREAWINKHLLGSRALVFIGLVSYPFYLWHWPLLSFQRIVWPTRASVAVSLGLVLVSFLLAWLTYRFIEQPIRHERAWRAPRRVGFLVAGVALAAVLGAGVFHQLVPARLEGRDAFVQQELRHDQSWRASAGTTKCEGIPEVTAGAKPFCTSFGEGASHGTFVVWGDSHAIAWSPVFFEVARQTGMRAVVFSLEGCPPLLGVRRSDGHGAQHCSAFGASEQILESIHRLAPRRVFLVARWSLYQHGWLVNQRLQKATHFLTTDKAGQATVETSRKALTTQLDETLRRLEGTPVTIVRTIPVLSLLPRIGLIRDPEGFEPTLAQHRHFESLGDELIDRAVQTHARVDAIDPAPLLCEEKCRAVVKGRLAYFDDNHLTAQGALMFQPAILSKLTSAEPPPG
ncbi:MAG TPA: acyltransferase family protein [Myxococcaceae bacterium]|jgi:peptidoglycan/LPS O-acetylase OafA/YrhL